MYMAGVSASKFLLAIKERDDERSGERKYERPARGGGWRREAGGPSLESPEVATTEGQDAGGNGAVIRDSGSGDGADSDGGSE